jgi:hypothetical protein
MSSPSNPPWMNRTSAALKKLQIFWLKESKKGVHCPRRGHKSAKSLLESVERTKKVPKKKGAGEIEGRNPRKLCAVRKMLKP